MVTPASTENENLISNETQLTNEDPVVKLGPSDLQRLEQLWNGLAIWLWVYCNTRGWELSRGEV